MYVSIDHDSITSHQTRLRARLLLLSVYLDRLLILDAKLNPAVDLEKTRTDTPD